MNNYKVVFVFSHPFLLNVWEKAKKLISNDQIDIFIINQSADIDWNIFSSKYIEHADAVYFAGIRHFLNFNLLSSACSKAHYVLPSGMEAASVLGNNDEHTVKIIDSYFKAGTPIDLANAARYLLFKSGKLTEIPDIPTEQLLCGIYHKQSDKQFVTLCEYYKWIETDIPDARKKPIVAFCFPRSWILSEDMALVDAIFEPLQNRGFIPLPVFCDGDIALQFGTQSNHPLDTILKDCNRSLSAVWNILTSHSSSTDKTTNPFESYGVPVFQIIRNYNHTIDEWHASGTGLSPMSICYSLTKPEMAGCIEPTLLACNETVNQSDMSGKSYKAVPVKERIEHLSDRTAKWHVLKTKSNQYKRIAIMLHNSPCKSVEATIATAAGLNAADSAVKIMNRLKCEGYSVDNIPEDGRTLIDLILNKKAISEFRWTNVEEIAAKGGVIAKINHQNYMLNFKKLPDTIQNKINDAWEPFPGQAMVYQKDSPDPCLLITGIWFGNILVMVEPKRGCWGPKCDGEVCRILHEPDIPPPHHWLATYWYLQKETDALISLGTESPLEYLPGKQVALCNECFPEISLGSLPLIYPYIVSATGEGLIAKRRGRGVLIDHLTPPTVSVTEGNGIWEEMEALHTQYLSAMSVNDSIRLSNISCQLRELMIKANLLDQQAGEDTFTIVVNQLPRRIESLRNRFTERGMHVLGNKPNNETVDLYIKEIKRFENHNINEESIIHDLDKTSDELDNLVWALSAHFVSPGPSGHLSRGKTEVIPTGKNFYGVDLNSIPTKAAWMTGVEMGSLILQKYLDEENRFPQSIAITLWSSDVFRSDGELISQALWLTGCRPVWNTGGRVTAIETIPREELIMKNSRGETITRPRIDIIIQMSSVVRDTLPNMYMLLDDAVQKSSSLDEPDDVNYVHAHVKKRMKELCETMSDIEQPSLHRLARCRIFSSKQGSYGTGIGLAIDAAAWENDKDLAEACINWSGFAYGKNMDGNSPIAGNTTSTLPEYSRLIGAVDIAYQKAIGPEYDALSVGCYSSFQGGIAAVNRAVGTGSAKMYWGDSSSGKKPAIRTLREEIDESLFAKLLNPDWIEQKKTDGYTGARSVSSMINTLFHWSASSHSVTDEQFDAVWRVYIENDKNREWLNSENIYALEEITRRLLEAASRKLWNADNDIIEQLKNVMLSIEGDMEERMGPVKGEFQGSSVDIKRRKDVQKWSYDFTIT